MSAATVTADRPTTRRASASRLTFGGVLKSEWIKLWTLRSTTWTLAITVVLMVGIALMLGFFMNLAVQEMPAEAADATSSILPGASIIVGGYQMAQLVVAVLGALIITGEYSTGMIRSTFSAVPRRLPAFFAKLAVLFSVSFVVTLVGVALSYLVTIPFVQETVSLTDGDNVRVLVGSALYVATIAALSLGIGTLLRSTAGAIFTVMGLLLVIPNILAVVTAFSDNVVLEAIYKYLPSLAGQQLMSMGGIDPMTGMAATGNLAPWAGYGVLAAWTLVTLIAAAVVLKRRDA
ncbi:ABC transporter permease subunit [Oerskovia turbata]